MIVRPAVYLCAAAAISMSVSLSAHDGPPFPILSDHVAGPYLISVWTDPDTTDDGSAGGQFWVRLHPAGRGRSLPPETRAAVAIKPLDRVGAEVTAAATPVRSDVTNQFAGLVMDHEGRFAVRVTIDGPLGTAAVESAVEATYDTRPAPALLMVYLAPFIAVGVLWGRLLLRRRTLSKPTEPTRRSHA